MQLDSSRQGTLRPWRPETRIPHVTSSAPNPQPQGITFSRGDPPLQELEEWIEFQSRGELGGIVQPFTRADLEVRIVSSGLMRREPFEDDIMRLTRETFVVSADHVPREKEQEHEEQAGKSAQPLLVQRFESAA